MGLFEGDKKKKRSGHKAPVPAASAVGPDSTPEGAKDPGHGVLMPLAGVSAPAATPAGSDTGSPPTVGKATTFTGKIVADEDLEVLGTVEGSIQLDQHHLTVGISGVVKADVEANSVLVIGRVTGNVSATDVVEIRGGGYIGGDVTGPRIIMEDGAIVIGALDMKAALPKDLVDPEPSNAEAPKTVGDVYRARSDEPA